MAQSLLVSLGDRDKNLGAVHMDVTFFHMKYYWVSLAQKNEG